MARVFDVVIWLELGLPANPTAAQQQSFRDRYSEAKEHEWFVAAPVEVNQVSDPLAYAEIANFISDTIWADCAAPISADVANAKGVDVASFVAWSKNPATHRHEIDPPLGVSILKTGGPAQVWSWMGGACEMRLHGYFTERSK